MQLRYVVRLGQDMLKRVAMFLVFGCAAGCSTVAEYHPDDSELWPLVAKSQVIATGTMSVPVEHIRACQALNRHDYTEIRVTLSEKLKGNPSATFVVRWYTGSSGDAPGAEQVIALDGKKVLLFLADIDEGEGKGHYFAGYTTRALAGADSKQIERVQAEVLAQKQLLARFPEMYPPEGEPLYEKVRNLINATTNKETQVEAFRALEELGPKGVPAIVMLMDDRRDLGRPAISLRNKAANSFEGIRHYGPVKVVDAMDAILNQITGCIFGNISSGGSEQQRQAAVDAWRVYLHNSEQAPK